MEEKPVEKQKDKNLVTRVLEGARDLGAKGYEKLNETLIKYQGDPTQFGNNGKYTAISATALLITYVVPGAKALEVVSMLSTAYFGERARRDAKVAAEAYKGPAAK